MKMAIKKEHIKNILLGVLWTGIGAAMIVLLVAAVKRKDEQRCKSILISISGVNNNFFIDKSDVLKIINNVTGNKLEGSPVSNFDLRKIEAEIEKDVWVDNAELFFDNNAVLQVNVDEREPVARIFTTGGNTFYIDSATRMLPLSEKFSARLPVFTGFPTDAKVLKPEDSLLLTGIKQLSIALQKDSFLMAMIDQVDITSDRIFEMTPKLGDQTITFGDGSNIDERFSKLKLFYRNVISKVGWTKYNNIDLQYSGQVVAKIRGKEDIQQDSMRALQLMDYMARTASMQAADSMAIAAPGNDNSGTDASLIQQSLERDEPQESGDNTATDRPATSTDIKPVATPAAEPAKPVVKKSLPGKPALKKPGPKKPAAAEKKIPRAVMPSHNEY